jgi:hypothetical protein
MVLVLIFAIANIVNYLMINGFANRVPFCLLLVLCEGCFAVSAFMVVMIARNYDFIPATQKDKLVSIIIIPLLGFLFYMAGLVPPAIVASGILAWYVYRNSDVVFFWKRKA